MFRYIRVASLVLVLAVVSMSLTACDSNKTQSTSTADETVLKYHDEALRAFVNDPEEGLRLATKAQLIAMYDVARVADTTAHQAWPIVQQNLQSIYTWATFHPNVYRQIVNDVIEWALKQSPPEYRPDWMINHGMVAMNAAMGGNTDPSPYFDEHDPQTDWQITINGLKQMYNNDELWANLHKDLEPQRALSMLKERNKLIIDRYSELLIDAELARVQGGLNRLLQEFENSKDNIGDRMYTYITQTDEFLREFMINR